jgi:hypothetical protein
MNLSRIRIDGPAAHTFFGGRDRWQNPLSRSYDPREPSSSDVLLNFSGPGLTPSNFNAPHSISDSQSAVGSFLTRPDA